MASATLGSAIEGPPTVTRCTVLAVSLTPSTAIVCSSTHARADAVRRVSAMARGAPSWTGTPSASRPIAATCTSTTPSATKMTATRVPSRLTRTALTCVSASPCAATATCSWSTAPAIRAPEFAAFAVHTHPYRS